MSLAGPSFFMLIILGALLAAMAVDIALIRRGLRGRAIDDHPVCRACGFDLFKGPTDQTACPECGADLSLAGAIRIGNRQCRRGLLYSGLTLMLITIIAAGVVGTRIARTIDTYRLLPDAWVERETRASLVSRQSTAWQELNRRFLDNSLSSERTARLVDAALARQADANTPWIAEMGDFVEAAHKAKALRSEKWLKYAKQAPHFTARARKQIRRGDPIAVEVDENGQRVAADSVLIIRPTSVQVRGDLVIERATPDVMENWTGEQMGTGSFSFQPEIDEDRPAMMRAPAGKHTVDIVAHFEVLEGHEMDPANAQSLFRDSRELSAAFELVEPGVSTVEIIPDDSPELRKRVEAAITIDGGTIFAGFPENMYVRYAVTRTPVPLAFRMIVRQGAFEWTGLQQIEAGSGVSAVFTVPAKELDGDRFEVIFEPDINAALESVDATRMWNGRVVFEGMAIKKEVLIEQPGRE